MMKKRIVSLGLAAMMTAGLFAGCGNSSESQGDSTASGSKSDDIVTLKWVTIGSGMPDRKSTRLNSSHANESRMPSSA